MLFSILLVRIITKSTKAVLFGFISDDDMGFVTRDIVGMGACNKIPTVRMHLTKAKRRPNEFHLKRRLNSLMSLGNILEFKGGTNMTV